MAEKMVPRGAQAPTTAGGLRHPLTSLQDDIDRMFDSFFPATFGRPMLGLDPWALRNLHDMGAAVPAMDVKECADHYEVAAELPGVDEQDVKVTIRGDLLSISGEKHAEHRGERAAMHVSERSFGSFTRSLRLPDNADKGGINAEYTKGVLTVTIPKQVRAAADQTVKVKAH